MSRHWKLALAALASCAAVFIGVSTYGEDPDAQVAQPTYEFGDIRIDRDPVPHDLEPSVGVSYTVAWATSEFPGTRSCRISVTDEAGVLVGVKVVTLTAAEPRPMPGQTRVPLLEGRSRNEAARASVTCSGDRLDDATGSYQFSDIRVSRAPQYEGDHRTFELGFDSTWHGTGMPGTETCTARFLGAGGTKLWSWEFTFSNARGTINDSSVRVEAPRDIAETPDRAAISCRPLKPRS